MGRREGRAREWESHILLEEQPQGMGRERNGHQHFPLGFRVLQLLLSRSLARRERAQANDVVSGFNYEKDATQEKG